MVLIKFEDLSKFRGFVQDFFEPEIMAYCPDDQKKNLVLKGIRAYVEQMQKSSSHPVPPRFNPQQIRLPSRPLRRPRLDINRNVSEKLDEIERNNDSDRGNVFKGVINSPPKLEDEEAVKKAAIVNNCICLRPICLVFCRYCGFNVKGRIKKECRVHYNVMFLMDINQCPKCKAYGLSEHPLPANYTEKK